MFQGVYVANIMRLFAAVLLACAAFGQSVTGTIEGNILDPTHLAVAGADVRLLQVETGFSRKAQTDQAGRFFFGGLQPAEYRLEVTAPGFKHLERAGVFLSAA